MEKWRLAKLVKKKKKIYLSLADVVACFHGKCFSNRLSMCHEPIGENRYEILATLKYKRRRNEEMETS